MEQKNLQETDKKVWEIPTLIEISKDKILGTNNPGAIDNVNKS